MTGLLAFIKDDQVIIAMDTLVVDAITKKSVNTITKMMPVLNSRSVICPVGMMELAMDLYRYIQLHVISKDIDSLIFYLKPHLDTIAKDFKERTGFDANGTVYVFGYSLEKEKYRCFKIDFDGKVFVEEMPYGLIARPHDGVIDPVTNRVLLDNSDGDLIGTMIKGIIAMKIENDKKPEKEKIHIGGNIQIAILSKDGYDMSTKEFFDFEKTYQECIANSKTF